MSSLLFKEITDQNLLVRERCVKFMDLEEQCVKICLSESDVSSLWI